MFACHINKKNICTFITNVHPKSLLLFVCQIISFDSYIDLLLDPI